MRVITLKQPWATLVAEGLKKYEFRSWKYSYRGELLIHAGKGIDEEAMKKFENLNLKYPQSRIVAKVRILDCIELNDEINKKIISENDEFVVEDDTVISELRSTNPDILKSLYMLAFSTYEGFKNECE